MDPAGYIDPFAGLKEATEEYKAYDVHHRHRAWNLARGSCRSERIPAFENSRTAPASSFAAGRSRIILPFEEVKYLVLYLRSQAPQGGKLYAAFLIGEAPSGLIEHADGPPHVAQHLPVIRDFSG